VAECAPLRWCAPASSPSASQIGVCFFQAIDQFINKETDARGIPVNLVEKIKTTVYI